MASVSLAMPRVLHLHIGIAGLTDATCVKLAASTRSKGIFRYCIACLVSSASVSMSS